jgi:hypothetical protein
MTRAEQIRKALEVLAPLPEEFGECRCRIEHALDIMESTIRAATAIKSERAAAQETGRGYYGALERLLAASRAHAHAGGALGISITSIERALQWRSKFSRALPSGAIIQRQAAALAYSLLWQSNHAAVTTRGGAWHTLGAILCGDQQADLFDYLREFKNDFPEQTETYLK